MKIMIVYSTTEGHTRTIAEFLDQEIKKLGHTAGLFNATVKPPTPEGYDAVILAGSVHAGKYQTAIEHYAREYHRELNELPVLFMSVSLTAASDDDASWKELKEQTDSFMLSTGLKPDQIEYVAGALLYTKYDFFKRFIMRSINKKSGGDTDTSQDHVYTDWDRVAEIPAKLVSLAGAN
ncbi:flavodoxin domain-containing protein [Rhodohalobacter mucosus]|uniref:Protoporphyrinogen oxidase n=1 Tax=Rhodohalobacter mucosus TaxID=2079485 RepID=A0A316U136_9BACT|nr:flavodoxin domain-containing protein [Rhodohalobacter mucosus]PWN06536.1 protoporphyrinogen oxidase [Rhodohalobacter mucosus]